MNTVKSSVHSRVFFVIRNLTQQRFEIVRSAKFRLMSVLLSILALPAAVQAQFDCTTNNGTITVTDYNGPAGAAIIPSTINGLPVTRIRNAAFINNAALTSISIPGSVVSIGSGAFSGCTNLVEITVNSLNKNYSSVEGVLLDKSQTTLIQCPGGQFGNYMIPSSVTAIGDGAFNGCVNLTGVDIPNSVTDIGDEAFYGCASLTDITIPNSVTSIGYAAFYGCASLGNVAISDSVTSIGEGAFSGCGSLAGITIPNSVTSIGNDTFSGCTNLSSITIPNSVTSIGSYAFSGCTSLSKITIPNSVISIGSEAFYGCTGLASVTIPNKIATIGNNTFYGCTSLNSVTIPISVISIGDYAFSGCTNLTSIAIPNKVTHIGSYVFYECTSLASVRLTNSLTSIGAGAFSDCTSLARVTIPLRVTSIGNNTFAGCTGLTNATLPSGVLSLGNYAFSGCTSLAGITIPTRVASIGNNAFSGCTSLTNIIVPNSVKSIGGDAFSDCVSMARITLSTRVLSIANDVFSGCVGLTNVTIPASVTSIGGNAFAGCVGLTHMTIPGRVMTIGDNAFAGCSSLASVAIASSVLSMGDYAFSDCVGLTNVTLPSRITGIGNYTFSGCTSLTGIVIPNLVTRIGNYSFAGCTDLTSVTIPSSVTSIGAGAFSGCTGLINISIPATVASVGYEAFAGCARLANVFFQGNLPPSVDTGVFLDANNVKVYYSSGTTGWGTVFSGQPTTPLTAPLIVQSPTNQLVQIGSRATFQVSAFGPGPISYQWRLNGTNVAGARSSTLLVSSVQARNAGAYTVVAANSHGSVTSSPGILFFKPILAITAPKPNLVVSNSSLAISGTAAGNFTTGSVSYQVGSSAWATAQGTTTWTGNVTLSPGVNWIRAYATDSSGNISTMVSNKVTYVPSAQLGITIAGAGAVSGTVSTKTSTSPLVAIGSRVTLTATANPGQAFLAWTGWTNSLAAAMTFTMPQPDLALTAQFVPSPFPPAAGVYKGLITANDPFDNTNSGAFVVSVTANGGYTAKLNFPAQTVTTSGSLGFYEGHTNAASAQFVTQIGGRSVTVLFELALDPSSQVSGSLTSEGSAVALARIDGAMVANTNLGLFNVAVLSTDTNPPAGNGYGSVSVAETGVKINLTLADDKAVITALSTDRLKSGLIPVFVPLYGTNGFLSGWLTVTNQEIGSPSPLAWHKQAGASSTFFAEGFSQWVDVRGGVYSAVTNVAPWGASGLVIDGQTAGEIDYASSTNSKGILYLPVAGQPTPTPWTMTSATGLVKLYSDGIAGNGILVPATASTPGIFGFTTQTVNGVGVVHSIYSGITPAPK